MIISSFFYAPEKIKYAPNNGFITATYVRFFLLMPAKGPQ